MDVTLLRTLTLKSTLKFGKYYDLTVDEILNSKGLRGVKWLTWAYYQADKISFMPDILEVLGITEQNRINKPGKVSEEEMLIFIQHAVKIRIAKENELSEEELLRLNGMQRKIKMAADKHDFYKAQKPTNYKDKLRAVNQGNFRK